MKKLFWRHWRYSLPITEPSSAVLPIFSSLNISFKTPHIHFFPILQFQVGYRVFIITHHFQYATQKKMHGFRELKAELE